VGNGRRPGPFPELMEGVDPRRIRVQDWLDRGCFTAMAGNGPVQRNGRPHGPSQARATWPRVSDFPVHETQPPRTGSTVWSDDPKVGPSS